MKWCPRSPNALRAAWRVSGEARLPGPAAAVCASVGLAVADHVGAAVRAAHGVLASHPEPPDQVLKVAAPDHHEIVAANLAGKVNREQRDLALGCAGAGLLEPVAEPGRVVLTTPMLRLDREQRMRAVLGLEVIPARADLTSSYARSSSRSSSAFLALLGGANTLALRFVRVRVDLLPGIHEPHLQRHGHSVRGRDRVALLPRRTCSVEHVTSGRHRHRVDLRFRSARPRAAMAGSTSAARRSSAFRLT